MPLFSAIDAVSPAMARWQRLLFRPFHWPTLLKLSFVALVAEGSSGGGFNFPSGGNFGGQQTHSDFFTSGVEMAFIVIFGVIATAIGALIFYLCCRMKFAEFQIAMTQDTRLGPAWGMYGRQTWKLFWLTLGIGVTAFVALAAVAAPIAFALLYRGGNFSHPSWQQILALVLVLLPIFLCWFLAVLLVMMVVRDLMLPFWALENASVRGAWRGAREIIERAPKDFALYALMKALLRMASGVVGIFALFICILISAIPVAMVGMGVYFPLRHGGPAASAGLITLAVLGGLICLAWIVLLYVVLVGAPLLALQCYALEWMGGRYPLLGNILWPPPPAPIPPPAGYPAPEDSGLPPLQPLPSGS